MTNVPKAQFTDRGFVAPAESDILDGVNEDNEAIFGPKLNTAGSTPQGQLATTETAIIGNQNDVFCSITNGVDPAYASGRMQDAIGRIYFIERLPALPTIVTALCNGAVNLKIPAGSLAKALDGNIYASTQDAKIGSDGTALIQFACTVVGPIPCAEGALSAIYRLIPGWDTITNPSEGVIGRDVENRVDFETRRAQSVAKNSAGAPASVRGEVLEVDGVLDAFVIDNPTNAPATVFGYTMIANSLYVAVVGGKDKDIGQAIISKKAPGCSYNGNNTVTVPDKSYDPPYPTYAVKFQRPASLPILFKVDLQDSPDVPSDGQTQVQNAIIAAFAGADGGPRARIAGVVYAARFTAPIAALGAWAQQIIDIMVGSENTAIADFTGSITGTVLTVTAIPTGALAVGQTIVANGVADGTTIISFGSGSGGTGTYNLSGGAQTVGSKGMSGVLPDQTKVDVDMDQAPTISAANIAVNLIT